MLLTKISDGFELVTATTNVFKNSLDIKDIISNTRFLHNSPHMILIQVFFFDAYGLKEKAQRWIANRGWEHQEIRPISI